MLKETSARLNLSSLVGVAVVIFYIAVDLNGLPHNVHHGASQSSQRPTNVYSKAVNGNE